jgi:YesN/AraC family two-component response regulator
MGVTTRSRPVVLAVDDEESVREVFRLLFEDEVELLLAGDGKEALEILRDRPVDLVLLDVLMPGLGGIEVLERIRQASPGLKVILVTAVDNARTAVAAMRLGALDYVTKPFDDRMLVELVLAACAMSRDPVVVVGGDLGMRSAVAALVSVRGHPVYARKMVPAYPPRDALVLDLSRVPDRAQAVLALLPDAPALGDLVWRAVEHVSREYPRTRVEDIATSLGASASHLARLFHEQASVTLREFLPRVRLEAAKQLLRDGGESLEAVAERVGFCDAPHLCRIFRHYAQVTPSEWRKSIQ